MPAAFAMASRCWGLVMKSASCIAPKSSARLDLPSSEKLAVRRKVSGYTICVRPLTEIRRNNLALLVRKEGSQAALANRLGKDRRQVNQWLGRKGARDMGNESAREIEQSLRLPAGWMDHPQDSPGRADESGPAHGETDRVTQLEREFEGLIGLLSILLARLGSRQPAEGAAVALELRKFLATPEYDGEALPELLRALEASVPSFAPSSRASRESSVK